MITTAVPPNLLAEFAEFGVITLHQIRVSSDGRRDYEGGLHQG